MSQQDKYQTLPKNGSKKASVNKETKKSKKFQKKMSGKPFYIELYKQLFLWTRPAKLETFNGIQNEEFQ